MPSTSGSAPSCRAIGPSSSISISGFARRHAQGWRIRSVLRQAHLGMAELELCRLPAPVHRALAGHRLHVPVPLEVERLDPQAHRAAHLLARLVVRRVLAERLDLPVAVTGVLLGVQLVRRGGAARETVVAGELLVHASGGAVGAAMHRLAEAEERDALEGGAVLAA